MKKIIFILFLIPPVLFYAACVEPPPNEVVDDPDIPDVFISGDWRYITIYLDGAHMNKDLPTPTAPVSPNNPIPTAPASKTKSTQRLLTPDTARKGFDFFEAVFSSGGNIVREAWEIGRRASVYDVSRDVDYSSPYLSGAGSNAAILFAGRKRDKTLLAVGKVVSVDNVPTTVVSSESSFVTFEVFAITGKLNYNEEGEEYFTTVSYNAEDSCFITQYDADKSVGAENTLIMSAYIGGRQFPLYKLPQGKAEVKAEYYLRLEGADWSDFSPGILVANVYDGYNGGIESGAATIRIARYPAGSGKYWYPVYPLDTTTNVKMTNNQIVGRAAENVVKFEFDTRSSVYSPINPEIGIFTLAFRVPVTPLLKSDMPGFVSPSDEGEYADVNDVTWFIRPAYQSYYYAIDGGVNEYGGGVLMGVFPVIELDLVVQRRWG